jgi:hypothetical protein
MAAQQRRNPYAVGPGGLEARLRADENEVVGYPFAHDLFRGEGFLYHVPVTAIPPFHIKKETDHRRR